MTAEGSPPRLGWGAAGRLAETIASLELVDLAAVTVVALFPLVELQSTPFGPTSLRLALLVGLLPIGLLWLLRSARRGDHAARWAVGLGLVVIASALVARHPLPSLVGDVNGRTSAVVLLGYLSCWGLGRSFRPPTSTLGTVLLMGGAAQCTIVLGQIVLLHEVEPYGTTGNSVFAAAIVGAAGAIAIARAVRSGRWPWVLAALPFVGVVCLLGSRAALAGMLVAAMIATWRRPRVLAGIVATTIVMLLVAASVGSGSVGSRLASHDTGSGYQQREEIAHLGLDAWTHRPLLGWGPGRFLEATSPRVGLGFVHQGVVTTRFADAHDLVIEYLTTLGPLGLLALVMLVWLALRQGEGEPRLVAVALVLFHLLEPQSLPVTPLLFLFLGASLPRLPRAEPTPEPTSASPRRGTVIAAVATLILVAEGVLIVGCDIQLGRAQHPATGISASRSARAMEPLWGTPASFEDDARFTGSPHPSAAATEATLAAARRAVHLDPTSPQFLFEQARDEGAWGNPTTALDQFEATNRQAPWYPQILAGLEHAADRAHQPTVAAEAHRHECELEGLHGPDC